MDKVKVIKKLNQALEHEMSSVARYLHQSFIVFGPHRKMIIELLREQAQDSMSHATRLGEKIVSLGGDPVVKILEIYEPKGHSIAEMLAADLKSEREAMEGYAKMLPLVAQDVALFSMLTRMVEEETQHLEEIEKMLRGL